MRYEGTISVRHPAGLTTISINVQLCDEEGAIYQLNAVDDDIPKCVLDALIAVQDRQAIRLKKEHVIVQPDSTSLTLFLIDDCLEPWTDALRNMPGTTRISIHRVSE